MQVLNKTAFIKEMKRRPFLKRWGQHFLIDKNIVEKIVEALELEPSDTVLEIGSGQGILTRRIAERVKKVIAIEIDKRLFADLEEGLSRFENVELVCADFLKVRLRDIFPKTSGNIKVVGNIPYNITSPILFRLLKEPFWKTAVLMVQREVAIRILSEPSKKTYGSISVGVRSLANVKLVRHISSHVFRPKPKVDSTILKFEILKNRLIPKEMEDRYLFFVRSIFSQRRKQLINALTHRLGCDKGEVSKALKRADIQEEFRPENLRPEDFIRLFKKLKGVRPQHSTRLK